MVSVHVQWKMSEPIIAGISKTKLMDFNVSLKDLRYEMEKNETDKAKMSKDLVTWQK